MYHVEVRSVKPDLAALPISETGYRSIWLVEERLEEYGRAVAYVTAFLEHKAKTKKWETMEEIQRQYPLF